MIDVTQEDAKGERSANVRVRVRRGVVQVHVERTSVRAVVPVPANIGVLFRTTNPSWCYEHRTYGASSAVKQEDVPI